MTRPRPCRAGISLDLGDDRALLLASARYASVEDALRALDPFLARPLVELARRAAGAP